MKMNKEVLSIEQGFLMLDKLAFLKSALRYTIWLLNIWLAIFKRSRYRKNHCHRLVPFFYTILL